MKEAISMKKAISPVATTPESQQEQGTREQIYQPGFYWVEITDHKIDKDPAGVPSLCLEILPIRRDFGMEVTKKHRSVVSHKRDPLAPYHDKRRVWLNGNGIEYFGVETEPIRIRADVLLHSGLDPNSTDPHGLTGAQLKFECTHVPLNGRMAERWLLQGPRRIFRIDENYN
jgi:hypothetical protein